MLAALSLCALVTAARLGERSGRRGAVLLAGVSVVWLLVNAPMEGVVLFTVTTSRGLTGADLAGFVGLGLAMSRWRAG
jgi:hypothetical protein